MTAFDASLLPSSDESPRCAAFSEALEVDPAGSALWVDEVIVAHVPLPWPKPVWAAAGFTAVPELVLGAAERGRRVRVLAAVPEPDGLAEVLVFRRRTGRGLMTRETHRVEPEQVATLLHILLVDGLDASPGTRLATSADDARTVLVCTQGSHDVCCGTRGIALLSELVDRRPDLDLRRVSHTGGHRFAPTAITMPDGRMWGFVDADDLLAVVDRHGLPSVVADRCRGWMGADGPGQLAERAVWSALDDWAVDAEPRQVEVHADGDGRWRCEVTVGSERWQVGIELGRAVPTIACGEPGGLPAKPGREYVVVSPPRVVP